MAHDLEVRSTGEAAYIGGKGVLPWWGLDLAYTTAEDETFTREEMFAKVDEFIVPHELHPETVSIEGVEYPTGGFSTVRRDDLSKVRRDADGKILPPKFLGRGFSEGYKLVPPPPAFEFTDSLVEAGDAAWVSAGLLAQGKQMFGVLQLPREILVANSPDERHVLYVMLTNSFDGSLSLSWHTTPIRAVCANTVRLAIARAFGSYTIKHNGDMDSKLVAAREALGISFAYADGLEAELNALIDTPISDAEFDAFLDSLVPGSKRQDLNTRSVIRDIRRTEDDLEAVRDTRYGALQAVAEYVDHRSIVRADSAEGRMRRSMIDATKSLVPRAQALLAVK